MTLTKYAKAIVAVLVAVVTALGSYAAGGINATDWVNVAIVGVGACAVFAAPNVPYAKYTKAVIAVLTAGLTVLASVIVNGISFQEWIQIAVAVAGALAVYATPNKAEHEVVVS